MKCIKISDCRECPNTYRDCEGDGKKCSFTGNYIGDHGILEDCFLDNYVEITNDLCEPDWRLLSDVFKYTAINEKGGWNAYTALPILDETNGTWVRADNREYWIGTFKDMTGIDWKQSLRKYKEI